MLFCLGAGIKGYLACFHLLPWDFAFGFLSRYLCHFNCKANTAVIVHATQWGTLQSENTTLWFIDSGVSGHCGIGSSLALGTSSARASSGWMMAEPGRLGPSLCPRQEQGNPGIPGQPKPNSGSGKASVAEPCPGVAAGAVSLSPGSQTPGGERPLQDMQVSLWTDKTGCFKLPMKTQLLEKQNQLIF